MFNVTEHVRFDNNLQSGAPYGVLRFSERADKNWKREYVDYLGTIQKRFLQEKLNSATKFDDVVDFRNFLVTFLDSLVEPRVLLEDARVQACVEVSPLPFSDGL